MAIINKELYEVEQSTQVKEANALGTLLRHKKSGARIFLLENDDPNKVFAIAFRTPPSDDTGVAHILEHSVLCGSEKYPVKDPFVELAKGSLNTFLNALTYPDKTIYPVASCNDTDFKNLMSVYMDAVLRPNIYHNKKIFLQEGWHYELEKPEDPLTINGVVYNEMKGAFASPNDVLGRYMKSALYPDTSYTYESGGDPAAIPSLSYEEFLNFHSTYYHPSNSYIYLYGNGDMQERLEWLDREYLCRYDRIHVDSEMKCQKPFSSLRYVDRSYGITKEESMEKKTFFSLEKVVGDALDLKKAEAFQILEYVLLTAPGAPLRQALLDAGIGEDVMGGVDTMRQISFEVSVRGADPEQRDDFERVVRETLTRLAEEGLDRRSLLAGININEFKAREADYGSYPTGLVYCLQGMDTWLYDDTKPAEGIRYEEIFAFLRENLDTGFFEDLIRRELLDNPHGVLLTLRPEQDYTKAQEEALAAKLAEKKDSLSEEELEALVEQTRALQEYQEQEDTKEAIDSIPLLSLSDIGTEPAPILTKEKEIAGVKTLHQELFTGGIQYLRLMFDCHQVELEDLPWISLLKSILGYVDTEHYSYRELSDEINIHTGGIDMGAGSYSRVEDPEHPVITFSVVGSSLYQKTEELLRLTGEILFCSKLKDTKRLAEILTERRSRLQIRQTQAGHSVAVQRCQSYFSPGAWISEQLGGLHYYHFLEEAIEMLKEEPERFIRKLESTAQKIFTGKNLTISATCDAEGYQKLQAPLEAFISRLLVGEEKEAEREYPLERKNEGFSFASPVSFVSQCGNFRAAGFSYTGSMRVLQTILGYDYLWQNIRVKAGAYGCMSGFSREGDVYLVSYRDPKLKETYEIYQGIPAYLEAFDGEEKDMERYIIGTVSDMDFPLNPAAAGRRSMMLYLMGISMEQLRAERLEVLNTGKEQIRALAPVMKAVLEQNFVCTVGNGEQLEKEAGRFLRIGPLL